MSNDSEGSTKLSEDLLKCVSDTVYDLRDRGVGADEVMSLVGSLNTAWDDHAPNSPQNVANAKPNAKAAAKARDIRMEPAIAANLDPDGFGFEVELWVNTLCDTNPTLDPDLWAKLAKLGPDAFEQSESREAAIWDFTQWYPPHAGEIVGDYERRITVRVYEAMHLLQAFVNVAPEHVKQADEEERS